MLKALVTLAAGYGMYHVLHTQQGRKDAKATLHFLAEQSGLAGDMIGRALSKTFSVKQTETKGADDVTETMRERSSETFRASVSDVPCEPSWEKPYETPVAVAPAQPEGDPQYGTQEDMPGTTGILP